MNDDNANARLEVLFAEPPATPDPAFGDRIIAIAAYMQAEQHARRLALRRLGTEALALFVILLNFALLSRVGPTEADLGDALPLASPAMLGLTMLGVWALVGLRPTAAGR